MALPLPWPILRLFAPLLNRILLAEPRVQDALRPLADKVVRVESRAPELKISVLFNAQGIELVEGEIEPDLVLRGPLSALMALRSDPTALYDRAITLDGDVTLGRALKAFIQALPEGIEELVAPWFGDSVAYRMGQVEQRVQSEVARFRERFGEDAAAWLEDEQRHLVSRIELEPHLNSVDDLAEAMDRLEQRVLRLESREGDAA